MSAAEFEYPPGPLTRFRRGLLVGLGAWCAAFMCVALVAVIAWFTNAGAGVHITSAIRGAAVVLAAANLGGARLNGLAVTLPPALVTVFLVLVLVQAMRRVDGRAGATGLVSGYAVTAAAVGGVRLGSSFAPRVSTFIAAFVLAFVVAAATLFGPMVLERIGARGRAVARAALIACLGYVAVGSLVTGLSLAMHLNTAADLQRDLASGTAGLPVLIFGLCALPAAVVSAIGVLAGATVSFGGHSSVSAWSIQHGRLPAFPLLAAVPETSLPAAVGFVLVAGTAAFVGWLVHRSYGPVSESEPLDRFLDGLAIAGLTGAVAAIATFLTEGSLGRRSMAHIGGVWWQSGLFVACSAAAGIVGCLVLSLAWRAMHHEHDSSDHKSHLATADTGLTLTRK